MKKVALTFIILSTSLAAACGGGGGSGSASDPSSPAPSNASMAGIWTGQYTVASGTNAGDVVQVMVVSDASGEVFTSATNNTNGCIDLSDGTATTSGNNFTDQQSLIAIFPPCTFADGSASGTGTVTGTVNDTQVTVSGGSATSANGTQYPNTQSAYTLSLASVYNNPSSLANVTGTWTLLNTPVVVSADGTFTVGQSPCVAQGQFTILDPNHAVMGISFTQNGSCGLGSNASTYTGLAYVNAGTSPATLYVFATDGQYILVAPATFN